MASITGTPGGQYDPSDASDPSKAFEARSTVRLTNVGADCKIDFDDQADIHRVEVRFLSQLYDGGVGDSQSQPLDARTNGIPFDFEQSPGSADITGGDLVDVLRGGDAA